MKRSGPDSLNSWIIAFACCFINTMMYGMARLSGVLFVASMTRFNVSRDRASLPYSVATFVRNASGPLVGYLGNRFGVRPVTTFGCLLGAIGAGSCYFAVNIDVVTFLWGAIFGLGFGLGNILLPVSINQHFDKHRASASGLSFSGACLGSFVLPPVVDVLLNTYGLSGTFLFLSGFILNCVPAALLLKKPDFDIRAKPNDCERGCETQSIVSGVKVKLYTVENECSKSLTTHKDSTKVDFVPKAENKDVDGYQSGLTYDEKIKRLSTQTLLSEYSIRMSLSGPLDTEQIIGNSKGRRMVDPKVHETESFSLSSENADQDDKDGLFVKDCRSFSFENEKPLLVVNKVRSLSSEHIADLKGKVGDFTDKSEYFTCGYSAEIDDMDHKNESDECANSITATDTPKNIEIRSPANSESGTNYSNQKNSDSYKFLAEAFKNSSKNLVKSIEWSDTGNFKQAKPSSSPGKEDSLSKDQSSLGAFSVVLDPMFILIAVTNAIYCFTFISIITIIVDYARDLQIGTTNEKYVLMAFSVGDFIGHLSLGWITDRGHMTTTTFAALCFACQGLSIVALVWANGFLSLTILISLYGLSEAGLIVIYPIIIGQYIDHDKQTVAIPSSNFLSGPLCLAVSPMIGYFRDQIGSYDYIFSGLAVLSAACGVTVLLAPYVAKCQTRSRCQTT